MAEPNDNPYHAPGAVADSPLDESGPGLRPWTAGVSILSPIVGVSLALTTDGLVAAVTSVGSILFGLACAIIAWLVGERPRAVVALAFLMNLSPILGFIGYYAYTLYRQ